jgi:hypothetical protein
VKWVADAYTVFSVSLLLWLCLPIALCLSVCLHISFFLLSFFVSFFLCWFSFFSSFSDTFCFLSNFLVPMSVYLFFSYIFFLFLIPYSSFCHTVFLFLFHDAFISFSVSSSPLIFLPFYFLVFSSSFLVFFVLFISSRFLSSYFPVEAFGTWAGVSALRSCAIPAALLYKSFSYFEKREVCFAISKASPQLKLLLLAHIYVHFACVTWQRTHLFFLYFTFAFSLWHIRMDFAAVHFTLFNLKIQRVYWNPHTITSLASCT